MSVFYSLFILCQAFQSAERTATYSMREYGDVVVVGLIPGVSPNSSFRRSAEATSNPEASNCGANFCGSCKPPAPEGARGVAGTPWPSASRKNRAGKSVSQLCLSLTHTQMYRRQDINSDQ